MSKVKDMKKSGMTKSHAFRMSEASVKYPKKFVADYQINGVEQVVENGRVVKKSCIKTVHPQDNFKGFKASDFALENVIAAGALDTLKEGYLSIGSTSELSDSLEGTIDNVIEAVNSAEAQSVGENNLQNNEGE